MIVHDKQYYLIGALPNGSTYIINTSSSICTLLTAAKDAVDGGTTGDFVSITVVKVVAIFPVEN